MESVFYFPKHHFIRRYNNDRYFAVNISNLHCKPSSKYLIRANKNHCINFVLIINQLNNVLYSHK